MIDPTDRKFLKLAQAVADIFSKDQSARAGAVAVGAAKNQVAVGYNGLPPGLTDTDARLHDRYWKLALTLHAEENALLFAGRPVEGCTLYVTHPPCARCAAKLIQAGIARVVAQMPAEGFGERWADDMRSASAMFLEAGVGFEYH